MARICYFCAGPREGGWLRDITVGLLTVTAVGR
jgi:hypothetical protein